MSDRLFDWCETHTRMPWGQMSEGQNYKIYVYRLCYYTLCRAQMASINNPNEHSSDDVVACLRQMVSRPLVQYRGIQGCSECEDWSTAGKWINFLRAGPAQVFAIDKLLLHMIDTHSIALPEAFLAAVRRDFVVWSECGGDPKRWGDFLTDDFFTRRNWEGWPVVYDSSSEKKAERIWR